MDGSVWAGCPLRFEASWGWVVEGGFEAPNEEEMGRSEPWCSSSASLRGRMRSNGQSLRRLVEVQKASTFWFFSWGTRNANGMRLAKPFVFEATLTNPSRTRGRWVVHRWSRAHAKICGSPDGSWPSQPACPGGWATQKRSVTTGSGGNPTPSFGGKTQ